MQAYLEASISLWHALKHCMWCILPTYLTGEHGTEVVTAGS